ncbi:MAG TPA: hypothetical protein VFE78_04620 [Gemmataceae bacterium]|nr:hypothetical protein [Gemmataceae bacterium]
MSRMTPEHQAGSVRPQGEDWEGRYYPAERRGGGGLPSGLLLGGLLTVGLGALAWYYLGPDLRRYMKIKSM